MMVLEVSECMRCVAALSNAWRTEEAPPHWAAGGGRRASKRISSHPASSTSTNPLKKSKG